MLARRGSTQKEGPRNLQSTILIVQKNRAFTPPPPHTHTHVYAAGVEPAARLLADLQQQAESQAAPEGQAALTDVQRARVFAQPLLAARALAPGADAWCPAGGASPIRAGLRSAQRLPPGHTLR